MTEIRLAALQGRATYGQALFIRPISAASGISQFFGPPSKWGETGERA
jgi:hypothetical protein